MTELTNDPENLFRVSVQKLVDENYSGGSPSDCERLASFIYSRIKHYSDVLGHAPADILAALEKIRDYYIPNFYQEANFPWLDPRKVVILRDLEHYKQIVGVTGFRCPACGEVSLEDPYRCTGNKKCNWKAYGLFRTCGKGMRLVLRDQFLQCPRVEEIFMPVALEHLFEDGQLIDGAKIPE